MVNLNSRAAFNLEFLALFPCIACNLQAFLQVGGGYWKLQKPFFLPNVDLTNCKIGAHTGRVGGKPEKNSAPLSESL